MLLKENDTRFKILKVLVDAKKPLTLSSISKKLKMPAQKVDYHLGFLEENGLIIKDGFLYFCQPLLIDEDLKEFCAEKLSEIIQAFSLLDSKVVVATGLEPEDVIINLLYTLIQIELP